jgi:ATP diphosphatase
MFSLANLCRHLKIDPERALRQANERFSWRFRRVEDEVGAAGGDWSRFDDAALDASWRRAKQAEQREQAERPEQTQPAEPVGSAEQVRWEKQGRQDADD